MTVTGVLPRLRGYRPRDRLAPTRRPWPALEYAMLPLRSDPAQPGRSGDHPSSRRGGSRRCGRTPVDAASRKLVRLTGTTDRAIVGEEPARLHQRTRRSSVRALPSLESVERNRCACRRTNCAMPSRTASFAGGFGNASCRSPRQGPATQPTRYGKVRSSEGHLRERIRHPARYRDAQDTGRRQHYGRRGRGMSLGALRIVVRVAEGLRPQTDDTMVFLDKP